MFGMFETDALRLSKQNQNWEESSWDSLILFTTLLLITNIFNFSSAKKPLNIYLIKVIFTLIQCFIYS